MINFMCMKKARKISMVLLILSMGIVSCHRKSGCPANQALQNQQSAIEAGSAKLSKPKSGALPSDGKAKKYKSKYR